MLKWLKVTRLICRTGHTGRNKIEVSDFISQIVLRTGTVIGFPNALFRLWVPILLILMCCPIGSALEPNEILVIANSNVPESVRIAQYYCKKRQVPADNLIAWPLGAGLRIRISRNEYERKLAEPLRSRLTAPKFAGRIKCLLTTYGIPLIVGGRGQLEGSQSELQRLK